MLSGLPPARPLPADRGPRWFAQVARDEDLQLRARWLVRMLRRPAALCFHKAGSVVWGEIRGVHLYATES